ncbi:hypothetical protein [Phaffia rhodozyma]|uniref:Uncharacterized protein n=1 Tax=Phaffia rhodozyma TaxID=264483 RepID=A0A0F7SJU5_PHARH|nr:hypothetical protein [Phaffia rhodozyma]
MNTTPLPGKQHLKFLTPNQFYECVSVERTVSNQVLGKPVLQHPVCLLLSYTTAIRVPSHSTYVKNDHPVVE